jgi:prepilin-type N-terminal cleavage/methylation domain-containing protein/prepilin-type processing-associated H-X9-DG protein
MRDRHQSGFTLTELLVVVGVMSLLAAFLFPVLAQARDSARRAQCLSNLRQLALAHRLYVQDHDDALPASQYPFELGPGPWVVWPQFLRPYYKDPRLLDQGFTTREERLATPWLADYVMCAYGPGGSGTPFSPYWRWPGAPWVDINGSRPMLLAEVRRPSEILQFVDGSTIGPDSVIRNRHRNGLLNGAFVDGHARVITPAAWDQIDRDERGYFYAIAAADR